MRLLAAALLLLLGACAPLPPAGPPEAGGPRVLALGDSVMMHGRRRGEDVGAALARETGGQVVSRAVFGAHVTTPNGRGLFGPDVARQKAEPGFDWIVLTGGGNDLGMECECRACEGVLDALFAADGASGEVPALAARLRATGARVIYVSYYGPNGLGSPFDPCADELEVLAERAERMARRDPGLFHVAASALIGPADPSDYARDNVHPSPQGAGKIARAVAETMAQAGAQAADAP